MNASAAAQAAQGPAVFCIHSIVGVGVGDFLPLARRLPGHVRAFGVQAPARRIDAEPEFGASLQALADTYAAAIAAAHPAGPIVLAGWSAGAAIGLEVARAMRAAGREIAFLAAIEGAPEIDGVGLRPWHPRYWLGVARNVPVWLSNGRGEASLTILRRWVKSLLGRMRPGRDPGPPVAARLRRLVSLERYPPAQRAFMARLYEAIMSHAPQSWSGPVVVYQARAVLSLPQYLERWRQLAPHAEHVLLNGNHVSVMTEPRVAELADDIARRIASATAPCGDARAAGEDQPAMRTAEQAAPGA